jgi:hypothetical protein
MVYISRIVNSSILYNNFKRTVVRKFKSSRYSEEKHQCESPTVFDNAHRK